MTDHITIPRALLEQWKQTVNTLAALSLKAERHEVGAKLKQSMADELAKPEQEESFIPDWANYRQGVADGKAGSPKWHDAPTEPGLWMCNDGDDNPYRRTTHRVTFPLNQLLVGENERWYGPIPQDDKAEGDAIKKGG